MSATNLNVLEPVLERVHRDFHWVRRAGRPPSRIDEPLTAARITKHLNGGAALGAVPIAPGTSTTRIALIDLDSHKGETPWPEMVDTALTIAERLAARGLRANAFRSSGGAGIHLLMLWESPQDARSVRASLAAVLESCGLSVGTKGVAAGECEVFPKQDEVGEGDYGSMFLLPLAGQSEALDPFALEPLAAEDLVWAFSESVETLPPEPAREIVPAAPVDLTLVRSAVDAVPNSGAAELDYDSWVRLVFAIHAATGGSDDGLELAHELSRKSAKYDEVFLDRNVWPHIKLKPDGVTVDTLFAEARKSGWQEDVAAEFEVLEDDTPIIARSVGEIPALNFSTDDSGRILPTITNVNTALMRPDWCGIRVGYDRFRDEVMWASAEREDWRAFKDTDYTRLRLLLEQQGFRPVSAEIARDVVHMVANLNDFDSAITWLEEQVPAWDGTPRVETFYPAYLRTVDTPYARAIGKYQWTAMAGRVLVPGCQADMVPVWVSDQGTRKTSSVKALACAPEHFIEVSFHNSDEQQARLIRGRLVGEIAELRGLHTKEAEAIKAWITRRHENWVPKYREFATTYPRRLLLIGTTNQQEFLADETGNRRWLPIAVGNIHLEAIERDRMQLWAEARERFKAAGVGWQGVVELATEAHDQHRERDDWEDLVLPYIWSPPLDHIDGRSRAELGLTTFQVLTEALGHDASKIGRVQQMRVAKILKFAGLDIKIEWEHNRTVRKWRIRR